MKFWFVSRIWLSGDRLSFGMVELFAPMNISVWYIVHFQINIDTAFSTIYKGSNFQG